MFRSSYRIKKQWEKISEYIATRDDFYPFIYGKNINMKIEDEVIRVYSKRDYHKKQEYIANKYGDDAIPSIDYFINYPKIFDDTEKKVAELLGTNKEKENGYKTKN